MPLKTKLFIERGNSLVWGGHVVEPRSYDSTTGKITINAEETWGYFAQRFTPTLKLYGTDQITIAKTIISTLQSVPKGNANLAVVSPGGLSGIVRDGVYSQYDFTDGVTALTDLTEMQYGFEIGMDVAWTAAGSGVPSETLMIAYPRLGKVGPKAVTTVFEYNRGAGGNVISYQWPEGPGMFSRTWADATTPDGVQLDAYYDAGNLLNNGYPLVEQKVDFTSARPTTLATLQNYANKQGQICGQELVAATFTTPAAQGLTAGQWALGDDVRVRLTDFRFPAGPQGQPGLDTYMRIAQVKCSTDSSGLEQYEFTLDNYWGLVTSG